jgi:glyoxylase-like metal-dependent hydrolase (beta-lactamase superfamily II)
MHKLIVGPIATNCYIYPLGGGIAAVIDPGGEADKIVSALNELNLVPGFILHTHGHFDHIGAAGAVIKSFPNIKVKVGIHRLDVEYLGENSRKAHSRSLKAAAGDSSLIDEYWDETPQADLLLEEGDTVGSLSVLHIPGHTQGSIAFWDKQAEILFSGDTLFYSDYGRTDLPGGSEEQIIVSLRRLFEMDGKITVYPGHGPATTIGSEAARGMVD